MNLHEWVANEMVKRLDRVLGQSFNLELLDFEIFKEENNRDYFFENTEENTRWFKQFAKDIEDAEGTLEYINGVSRSELDTLKKTPDKLILLIINHVAAEIILDGCDESIPWELPSLWTNDLIMSTGLKHYVSKQA